jgi:hypothetical protein
MLAAIVTPAGLAQALTAPAAAARASAPTAHIPPVLRRG